MQITKSTVYVNYQCKFNDNQQSRSMQLTQMQTQTFLPRSRCRLSQKGGLLTSSLKRYFEFQFSIPIHCMTDSSQMRSNRMGYVTALVPETLCDTVILLFTFIYAMYMYSISCLTSFFSSNC